MHKLVNRQCDEARQRQQDKPADAHILVLERNASQHTHEHTDEQNQHAGMHHLLLQRNIIEQVYVHQSSHSSPW